MRQRLALLGGALAVMLIAAGAWLGFVYSGFYNVAATDPHSGMVEWTLETISERSVRRRADALPAPLPVDSTSLQQGFDHYRLMCEVCHGGVGVDRSEIAEGLSPRPPRLARAAAKWSDAELFWITKHGIKATGMPAFGVTHDDASLLQIIAAVRRLPEMTEAEYAARTRAGEVAGVDHEAMMDDPAAVRQAPASAAGGHSHAPGAPAHAH